MKFSYTALLAVFAAIAHAAPVEDTSSPPLSKIPEPVEDTSSAPVEKSPSPLAKISIAPREDTSCDEMVGEDRIRIPSEAIIGVVDYTDITPVVLQKEDGQNELVFLNATIMEQAHHPRNQKRDADAWHWIWLRPGAPIWKRDAEADADAWHWVFLRPGAPIWKRETDEEAEASA